MKQTTQDTYPHGITPMHMYPEGLYIARHSICICLQYIHARPCTNQRAHAHAHYCALLIVFIMHSFVLPCSPPPPPPYIIRCLLQCYCYDPCLFCVCLWPCARVTVCPLCPTACHFLSLSALIYIYRIYLRDTNRSRKYAFWNKCSIVRLPCLNKWHTKWMTHTIM